eukprot:1230896-Amphidinium_carterae.1
MVNKRTFVLETNGTQSAFVQCLCHSAKQHHCQHRQCPANPSSVSCTLRAATYGLAWKAASPVCRQACCLVTHAPPTHAPTPAYEWLRNTCTR